MDHIEHAYAQGFLQKCAESGISPEDLLKEAERIPEEDANKFLSYAAGILPVAGPAAAGLARDSEDPIINAARGVAGGTAGGLLGGIGGAGLGALLAALLIKKNPGKYMDMLSKMHPIASRNPLMRGSFESAAEGAAINDLFLKRLGATTAGGLGGAVIGAGEGTHAATTS